MGELKWASVCPPSLAATSSMWTKLKHAHPNFPWWGYFHWVQAARQRNWLSTCAWQCGRSLQLCCSHSFPTGWDLTSHEFQTSDFAVVSFLLEPGLVSKRLHPSLHTEVPSGTANRAFSATSCYPGITASLCACLCHSLNLCLLHSSWNELKWLSGCFLLP